MVLPLELMQVRHRLTSPRFRTPTVHSSLQREDTPILYFTSKIMSTSTQGPPKVTIKMELSPNTYHFSNATPPTLSFRMTSYASRPLTIRIPHGSPLDVKMAMNQGGYPIFDLSTPSPTPLKIGDMTGYIHRPPSPNKQLVLLPERESVPFEVAFNRGASYEAAYRPQPWDIVRRGRVLDDNGNETSIRRPSEVAGVDGLEAGKKYKATMALNKLQTVPWWWGTEDDEPESRGMDNGPIEFEVEDDGVEFSVEA